MQHACTNKCLPLQEHLDVCFCPWHFHKSKVLNRGIYEFTNAENHVSNFWTLYHQSMFKLSRVFSPGLTAPTPWSVPRCPNPWNTSASFWRPGCWKLEFYYLKGHAVKGHHWDSSDFLWNCLYKPSVSVILTVCSTNLVTIGDPINSYQLGRLARWSGSSLAGRYSMIQHRMLDLFVAAVKLTFTFSISNKHEGSA